MSTLDRRQFLPLRFRDTSVAIKEEAPTMSNPCSAPHGTPEPPKSSPVPAGGTVTDDQDSGISGATMLLYKCTNGSSSQAQTTTTDEDGNYSFAIARENAGWYYVQAQMTGPLSGMSPAAGTSNPSELVEVGEGSEEIDFVFE